MPKSRVDIPTEHFAEAEYLRAEDAHRESKLVHDPHRPSNVDGRDLRQVHGHEPAASTCRATPYSDRALCRCWRDRRHQRQAYTEIGYYNAASIRSEAQYIVVLWLGLIYFGNFRLLKRAHWHASHPDYVCYIGLIYNVSQIE